MTNLYQHESEIQAVVDGLESCSTDKTNFKHRDHLTVAVSYLVSSGLEDALERLRLALFAFLDHHQVDRVKYNETITIFWLQMVRKVMNEVPAEASLVDKCNHVLDSLGNPELVFDYYTRETLLSDEARVKFVKPDLKVWDDSAG
jgi:hypothetical protein